MENYSQIAANEEKLGISWCLNCVGFHPDEFPTFKDFHNKMLNPQKDAWTRSASMKYKLGVYRNKSCAMCGRSYDNNGALDETWVLTAKRVREELIRSGIFNVDDKQVEMVVAQCRKSFTYLLENRFKINPKHWERMNFSGALTVIITSAQKARKTRLAAVNDIKGPVR